jgi:hypothetical protein
MTVVLPPLAMMLSTFVVTFSVVAFVDVVDGFVPAPGSLHVVVPYYSSSSSSSSLGASSKKSSSKSKGKKTTTSMTPVEDDAVACVGDVTSSDPYSFVVPILGDLHIDPRKMEDYVSGREHVLAIIDDAKSKLANGDDETTTTFGGGNIAVVSLGDLGESKNCDHNPDNPYELFAGTSLCHAMAADFLGSFGVPYEVICGNHDLEGIDEFDTDARNLRRMMKLHGKETPQFCRRVAEKTLLVGLCSTTFRDAKYTSHEVIIDEDQINWFEDLVKKNPADEGWRIFVFSHAPPNGSGIRIIQENHVVNGCCWLNHSDERNCRRFIEIVREHRCIKGWFSGHFHLGQDYQDSITVRDMMRPAHLFCCCCVCITCAFVENYASPPRQRSIVSYRNHFTL